MSFTNSESRQVVVDDTDHQILYTGAGWFLVGSQDTTTGDSGRTSLYTLHNTKVDGGLSFSFQGTQITVLGINDILGGTWQCFVDGVSTTIFNAKPIQLFPGNVWELCSTAGLKDGPHQLMVNVTTSGGRIFSLDSIRYSPSPGLSLEPGAVLQIDNTDPEITYDSGWTGLGNTTNMTRIFGSTASFRFTGTGLSWIGSASWDLPHIPSQGTYSIDGGPQITFRLEAIPPGNVTTQYHQEFFSTGYLPAGPHTLRVTYQGNDSQTPLTLDYLHVMTSSSPATTTSSANPSNGSSNTHGRPVKAIVGGVVGGTAFIILIVLAVFFWYRWQRNGHASRSYSESSVTPYSYDEGSQPAIARYGSMLGTSETDIRPNPTRLLFHKNRPRRPPQEDAPPSYTNALR